LSSTSNRFRTRRALGGGLIKVFCPAPISSAQVTVGAVLRAALGCRLFPTQGPPAGRPLRGRSSTSTVGAVLCAALGCRPFPTSGPPAGRPLREHSSNHTVGAVINRPHWWMTFAPDKTVGLYQRAMDNRPYRKTPLPGANIILYPLSFIHYPTAYASGG